MLISQQQIAGRTMSQRRATICFLQQGDDITAFQNRLWNLVEYTPLQEVELRFGFSGQAHCLHYALGALCPDGATPSHRGLFGGIDSYNWSRGSATMRAWQAPEGKQLLRLLLHDVRLETDYAICLDAAHDLERGWWEALTPILESNADYVGQPQWRQYQPGELEAIRARPWYLGVPFERRAGHAGVTFMRKGLMAVRCQRLREANYPEPDAAADNDYVLGEIARQLVWSRAEFPASVKT